MSARYVHTCLRVRDPEASVRFYGALGFEPRGRLNFSTAYNLYLGLPGDGDVLELTVNRDQEEPYDLGTGYNHMAITVDDIDAVLAALEPLGVAPEKPPYHPAIARTCRASRSSPIRTATGSSSSTAARSRRPRTRPAEPRPQPTWTCEPGMMSSDPSGQRTQALWPPS